MRAAWVLALTACGRVAFDARDDAGICQPATSMRQMSISERHGCSVDKDGETTCSGTNVEGELGTGTFDSSIVPVRTKLQNVQKISAGLNHTCALDAANTVWCWGNNGSAQLGQGSFTLRTSAEPLSVLDNVIDIEASFLHTCAMRTDKSIWCWGGNGHGVLGDGTYTIATAPQQVTMGGLPAAIDRLSQGSRQHQCVVAGGSVWCWGTNEGGQVGDGGNADRQTPFQVPGTTGAVQAVVGNNVSCARFTNGSAKCWGTSDEGVLGAGTVFDAPAPTDVLLPEPIIDIAAAVRHVCAITETNALLCWGSNAFGQLGDGTRTQANEPRYIPDTGPVASVAMGYDSMCIVRVDGTTACWGDNDEGQLGTGTRSSFIDPIELATGGVLDLVAGATTTCIATPQGVSCTGDNIDGAVGDGTFDDKSELVPVSLPAGARLARSSTNQANCAFVPGGSAYCWGHGKVGTLGDGARMRSSTPVQVATLTAVSAMSVGNYTVCAIRATDDTLWCWGNNSAGQLGDNTVMSKSTPQQVTLGGITPPIQAVGVSRHHTCAANGTQLYCWGQNNDGKLGDGTYMDRRTPTLVTTGDFKRIVAGDSHSCALDAAGILRCWGSGQRYGGSSGVDQSTPTQVLDNVLDVDGGDIFTCAVRTDNTLWCWGNCNRGSCGPGVAGIRTVPTQVAGVTDALEVSAGDGHTCVTTTSGTVRCWGSNVFGQLARPPVVTRTPSQPACAAMQ